MITAIIPVFNNIQITKEFFDTISYNTIQPKEIILIDNGSVDKYYKLVNNYKHLNINYIRHETNVGVNAAWNEGIKISTTPYLSILNNDLLLNKYFFQKLIETFEKYSDVGIVIPSIVKTNKNIIHNSKDELIGITDIKRRNGCAFTIRKEITDKIPPIPKILKTYCGDDYLFKRTLELGYRTVRMNKNFVYHYGGATVNKVWPDKKTTRKEEKKIYLEGENENTYIKSKSNRKI